MGSVASTPRGDAQPKEQGDYLLGVLVGKRAVDIHSQLWERLLNLPLALHWPDTVINEACENIAQNSTSTGHLAKLLFHLAWTLQEAVSGAPDSHLTFAKATNAVRFSSVFLKYSIEHLTSDGLTSCLSLCLNDKEADMTGLTKGNQNVASFVVLAMLSFIGNSDVNPSTYLLHLEVGNLLLVMMSTQLHSAVSPGPKNIHIFLDAAMLQETALVSLVVRKLLLSYIAKLPVPLDAAHYINLSKPSQPGVLQRVGSAAAIVLRFPYYTYSYLVSSKSSTPTGPLAQNSLLLLLVLIHHRKVLQLDEALERKIDLKGEDVAAAMAESCLVFNPFCQALGLAKDTEFNVVDAENNAGEVLRLRIPFTALYDTLGLCLTDECSVLLLYSLVHRNSAFLEYVLVRTDLDTLLMPLLEMLYDAPRKSTKQIYMLLIILLILSQDSSFNASMHKLVLPGVPWFKERLLTQTTLGSLMIVILIRTVKYNLATLRDVYLHTNCLATLSNMAPHVHKLNAYAAQRLVSLFDMLSRKYIKLADASAVDKSSSAKVSSVEELETAENVSTELHIYTDFLRIVLEIINAILTYALPRNPEVVYALLHRQELFQPFRDHLRFNELIENIFTVLSFFNMRLDAQNDEGEWSVENVLQVIIANTRSWRGEGMKMFTQLQFTYEEELCPEEFFVPYVWQLVVSRSGIAWDNDTITLFPSKSSIELDRLQDSSDKGFEMPSTPRVEV